MAERPAKPFDTTLRELVRADPRAWLGLLGRPTTAPVEVLDTNVSALQAEVDAAILVAGPEPWIQHVEFQTSYDPELPSRVHHYNELLGYRPPRPVESAVVLLRPAADGPALGGRFERRRVDGSVYRRFEYAVIRLWERPPDELLAGPLALLPLAPVPELFRTGIDEVERLRRTGEVVRRLGERIRREAPPDRAPMLWAETFFVLGLRYSREDAGRFLRGVRGMRDSLTYQAVLEEGRAEGEARGRAEGLAEGLAGGRAEGRIEEARRLLRRLGEQRFGPPDAAIAATIETLTELDAIERATLRLLDAASWNEALAEQADRQPPA